MRKGFETWIYSDEKARGVRSVELRDNSFSFLFTFLSFDSDPLELNAVARAEGEGNEIKRSETLVLFILF